MHFRIESVFPLNRKFVCSASKPGKSSGVRLSMITSKRRETKGINFESLDPDVTSGSTMVPRLKDKENQWR